MKMFQPEIKHLDQIKPDKCGDNQKKYYNEI
jgi:hypothetical protein